MWSIFVTKSANNIFVTREGVYIANSQDTTIKNIALFTFTTRTVYHKHYQKELKEKTGQPKLTGLCRRRPIFPGRFQPSIVSTDELNYRVRDGNGWDLNVIDTDFT